MNPECCIVTARLVLTLLAVLAVGACANHSTTFFDSTHGPNLDAALCRNTAPSPERLAQFIDTVARQNAPFVLSAQSLRLRESVRVPASPSTSDEPIQTQGITLRLEIGDTFPTLMFPLNSSGALKLRLDPFLRRAHVSKISRIAVSPDTRRVAIIVRTKSSNETGVLIIDRTLSTSKQLELPAYDLSWLGNELLLISTLAGGRPRSLYLHQDSAAPRLLYSSQQPADDVLLAPYSSPSHAFIEVRSPTTSSIFSIDSTSPAQMLEVLRDDLPGASCTLWRENYTCLSFKNNRAGEVLILAQGKHRVLAKGSLERPIVRINSDQRYLRLFFSTGTATALQIFASTSESPVNIKPLGPLTTLSPAATYTGSSGSGVKARSFLTPTRVITDAELLEAHSQDSQALGGDAVASTPYSEEALTIQSTDGVALPVSLVRPPNVRGLVIQAYGAYGVSSYAEHSSEVMTLLENGIAVAIAHVRGGGELGPAWHIAGMGVHKSRAVDDLVLATQHLQRYLGVSPKKTVLRGRSAGSWLIARAAMTSHNLFSGMILDAPLLHLEAALSSPDAPLYHRDRAEWGNAQEARRLSAASIHSVTSFPFHIFVSVPMQDTLISPADTLSWTLQVRCKQPPGYGMVLRTLPTAEHDGPTTAQDAIALETLQMAFISDIIAAQVDSR